MDLLLGEELDPQAQVEFVSAGSDAFTYYIATTMKGVLADAVEYSIASMKFMLLPLPLHTLL